MTKLSRKIIKPLLNTYLKGQGWKKIMKNAKINTAERVKCTDCQKSFGKGYIKTHMVKMHKNSSSICNKTFKKVYELKVHKDNSHSQADIEIIKDIKQTKVPVTPVKSDILASDQGPQNKKVTNHQLSYSCKQCNLGFETNMEVIKHNEKTHIPDNWPDSGSKRDVSMVKTSSVVEPKKKKAAE